MRRNWRRFRQPVNRRCSAWLRWRVLLFCALRLRGSGSLSFCHGLRRGRSLEFTVQRRYTLLQFENVRRKPAYLFSLSAQSGNPRKRNNGQDRPGQKCQNRQKDQKLPS